MAGKNLARILEQASKRAVVTAPVVAKGASKSAKLGRAVGTGMQWSYRGFILGATVSQILDLLESIDPERTAQLYSLAREYGFDLKELKDTADAQTNGIIMMLAGMVGFTADDLATAGIHPADVRKHANMIARYSLQQRDKHDASQIDVVEEEGEGPNMQRLKPMAYVAARLGLSGPARARQLYMIAMVINSIKDEHVTEFEEHERRWGSIPTTGVGAF